MYKILALDDDKFILASLLRSLRSEKNWQVDTYNDPTIALEHAHHQNYDLFLSDYQMPGLNGIEFLSRIKLLQPASVRIILSGQDSNELVQKAIKEAGVYSVVSKPVQQHELIATINLALQHYKSKQFSNSSHEKN